jgi:ADP-sugar diphosphatase
VKRVQNITAIVAGKGVPVEFAPGVISENITWEMIKKFHPFANYCQQMEHTLRVEQILIESVHLFGSRIGFVMLKATIYDQSGNLLPGIAFLRGGSVCILPVIYVGWKRYTVLVHQARTPVGSADVAEIPAGGVDGSTNFRAKAQKELEEEVGLKGGELIDLYKLVYGDEFAGFLVSPGGSDEFLRIFIYKVKMTRKEIALISATKTGLVEEGESITLEVVRLDELWRFTPDQKTATAVMLYLMATRARLLK